MNVLSLFDGMSCGQIALRELGMPVDSYFACEIDRHAVAQTTLNFPDTVHLGDVRDLDTDKLPRIDLLQGGPPCTDFSIAGRRRGMSTETREEVTTLGQYLRLEADGFEFAGLQTIPQWYRWECSDTQQYRMLGNGWTVEVIKHILSFLPETASENKNKTDMI